jgi:hypothetical protein
LDLHQGLAGEENLLQKNRMLLHDVHPREITMQDLEDVDLHLRLQL